MTQLSASGRHGLLLPACVIVIVATGSALYGQAERSTKLAISEIKWSTPGFSVVPTIAEGPAKDRLRRGVDAAGELIAFLEDQDSFVTAHIVLTELWRVPSKEQFSVWTNTDCLVVWNGLHLRVGRTESEGQYKQHVVVLDEEGQRKRLQEWWKARYRDYPLEFSSKTPVHYETPAARRTKPSNDDVDWEAKVVPQVALSINPARDFLFRGPESSAELLPLLDDPDSFVAAHVLMTELWRIPERSKEKRSVPISTGFFVFHNGLHARVEWKEVKGVSTKTITIPDEDWQRRRLSQWWKARHHDHPEEFSSESVVD